MKRSEINRAIREVDALCRKYQFSLPPFAYWRAEDWKTKGSEIEEIREAMLGWDVTDFGQGDFSRIGLAGFTLRNGVFGSAKYPKTYAEKILVSKEEQYTPYHYHAYKMEDIINRGGGNLFVQLYQSTQDDQFSEEPLTVVLDGTKKILEAGSIVRLTPGESITLTQGLFHQFWGEKGKGAVLIGEVSMCNDDNTDNIFYDRNARFSSIEEDEPMLYPLCNEYVRL